MNEKDRIEAIQGALGEPVIAEFTDNTLKIRRNLLFISAVSIGISLGGVQISSGSELFGIKFTGLTDDLIKTWLTLITIYLFVHFLWCSFDGFMEWRLRMTGTRLAFVTAGKIVSDDADYPDDPRQSTLYSWWVYKSGKIGNISAEIDQITSKLETWEDHIGSAMASDECSTADKLKALTSVNDLKAEIVGLARTVETTKSVLINLRIPASLERFDGWFKLFLRSQNLRWFIVELLFPVVLGAVAVVLLIMDILK